MDKLSLTTPTPDVADLAGAAAALGATMDELFDWATSCPDPAGAFEEELAAMKLQPLVRRRMEKEWAARQKGAQGEGAVTAVPATKPTVSQALRPRF